MDCSLQQAPLSMGFSRQECQSGLPCPPPGDLANPGIEPITPALQADSSPTEPPGKSLNQCFLQINISEQNCWILWQFYFNVLRNFPSVFHSGYTNLHSHQQCTSVLFSPQPCQHLLVLFSLFFDDSHSDRCEVISHYGFDFIPLMISDVEHFVMCLLITYMSSLEKYLFRCSAHLLIRLFGFLVLSGKRSSYILVLSGKRSSYIWDINPLLDRSSATILSHSVDRLFVWLMVSFTVQKLFSLMQSYLFIFSFVSLA